MKSIKIMTDSASDISKQEEQELNIDVMCFPITVGDKSCVERVDFENEEFYQILLSEPKIPSTAQITMIQFEEKFNEIYQQGYQDLIYVSINGAGSNTCNSAIMARTTFFEKHPDAAESFRIHVVDSKTYSSAYGYAVVTAAQKAKKGMSANEIVAYLKDWFDSVEIYFAPYTLEFVKKSGRVSCAAAFMGELLGLRPIISIIDGKAEIREKVRGDKMIIPTLLHYAKDRMTPKTPYILIKGMLEEPVQALQKDAEKLFGYPPEAVYQAGAAITINAGPKIAAIIVKGRNRSL